MVGVRSCLQYCRIVACSKATVWAFILSPPKPAVGHSVLSPAAVVHSEPTLPPRADPVASLSSSRSPSGTERLPHPSIPNRAPGLPPFPTVHSLPDWPTSAARSSLAFLVVAPGAGSVLATADHSYSANVPAAATAPKVWNRPTLPACVPKPPGNAPNPE